MNKLAQHSKAIAIWSAVASGATFVSALTPLVPAHYHALIMAIGGLLAAISSLHASNSGPASPQPPADDAE